MVRRRIPVTIWMSEGSKNLFYKKFYEIKAVNNNIETVEDFVMYLLNSLVKQY